MGQFAAQDAGFRGIGAENVVFLIRVLFQIIEFRARGVDVFVCAKANGSERRPAKRVVRVHGLAVNRARRRIEQCGSFERRWRGDVQEIEDGGGDIDEATGLLNGGWPRGGWRGPMDDQRDVQRALIDKVPVGCFAVIAEAFAMVGKQNG